MVSVNQLKNSFNTNSFTNGSTPKGEIGYDNPRQEIDPIILEKVKSYHVSGADLSLGNGCVALDHGTGTTDMVTNICYGTSSTPPTASTTTEGTIYFQHAA